MNLARFLCIITIFFISFSYAADFPLNQRYPDYTAQNSGKTGIIEMPNARVMDDWRVRANFDYGNPFMYYGVTIAPFPRLEMNFRITQIRGVPGFTVADGYGDYKDKAIDLKFLLVKEDDVFPAVALGLDDITGTALYSSKYIALSKRIGFLDITGGYAIGRMGGYATREYIQANSTDNAIDFLTSTSLKGSFFAGIEAHLTPDIALKAEYSPIDYSKDRANAFARGLVEAPASDFNFGITYNLTDKLNLSANFERGNSYSLGFKMLFPFAKEGLYPHEPDTKWRASTKVKNDFRQKNDKELIDGLANEVAAERFSNVDVALNHNKAWIGFDNTRYNSDTQALGRAADTIDEVAPEKINTLYLALKYRGMEYSAIEIDRSELKDIKKKIANSDEEMQNYIQVYSNPNNAFEKFSDKKDIQKSESIASDKFTFVHRPHLQSFLNAKDNPFVYRLTWLLGYQLNPWDGAMIQHRFRFPITSTMNDISDKTLEPENLATRTDVLKYQQYNKVQMNDLTLDQVFPLPFDSIGKASLGYFEAAYAGYTGEWYKPLFEGKYGIGLEYQKVWKREVDDFFKLSEQNFEAKFVNFYAVLSEDFGLSTSLKVGQFLAGDKGWKLTLTRQYKDFTIGAYLAKTDTSIFSSQENRDYVDKGIFITVPLSVVKNQNLKGNLHYGLSAWTRDVAQSVSQPTSLVGTKIYNGYRLKNELGDFKE